MRDLSREDPPTLVIIMTGFGSLDSAEQAMKQGAFDYLTKPLERDDLLRIVGRAFDRIGLIQENRLLRQQLEERYRVEGIVGSHYRMQEVFDKLHKVSSSSSTVLIVGRERDGQGAGRPRHPPPRPAARSARSWRSVAPRSPRP